MAQGKISRHTSLSVLDRIFRVFLLFCFFLFVFFPTPPLGTEQKSSTHSSIGPRPISHFPFFFPRHLVAQSRSLRHAVRSVLDRFFFFYATSWRRAEVFDTLLERSSTDFSFPFLFPRHLVAQSRGPRHTARSVLDRFFFFTPPRGTEQKSTTHCSNSPRHYVARQAKRNTTVRLKRTLAEAAHSAPLKGQVRKGANSINNFHGPPTQTGPKYIATLIQKKKQKEENN